MADTGLFVPLQVGAPFHPKLIATNTLACWLWIVGLCYCKQQQTDGFIPTSALALFPFTPKLKTARVQALAKTLVTVGLWEGVDGGYIVHDFLAYNPSRAQLADITAMKRVAGALGGRASKNKQVLEAPASAPASAPAGAAASLRAVAGAGAAAEAKRREEN